MSSGARWCMASLPTPKSKCRIIPAPGAGIARVSLPIALCRFLDLYAPADRRPLRLLLRVTIRGNRAPTHDISASRM